MRGERNPNSLVLGTEEEVLHAQRLGKAHVNFRTVACSLHRTVDMRLAAVVNSMHDDVNIAVFHPWVGHGFAYGTKQGQLCVCGSMTRVVA